MIYRIFEGNIDRLEKKLNRIKNKCVKYNCEFLYEIKGEEYQEFTLPNEETEIRRFILAEIDGTAIINDWEFIASVEQTEKGNIFSKAKEYEIPKRYYDCNCLCEHCNNTRVKYTYIIRNTKTEEYKMVGKNCLKDFTHGVNANDIANFYSFFDNLAEFESVPEGGNYNHYIERNYAMKIMYETIRKFGYEKSHVYDDIYGSESTSSRSKRYYDGIRSPRSIFSESAVKEMKECDFDYECSDVEEKVKDALNWIEKQEEKNDYMHNLKVAATLDYITFGEWGLLCSLFPVYDRDLERQARIKLDKIDENNSKHQGNVGDKINFKVSKWRCLTSWMTDWGYTHVYKFVDDNGNVYTWKTSKYIDDVSEIKGTVKSLNEYNGISQTELTRCKIIA